ncbi:MAG: hypothetical protein ACNA8W_04345 [Bradymonadaceae bacterium]
MRIRRLRQHISTLALIVALFFLWACKGEVAVENDATKDVSHDAYSGADTSSPEADASSPEADTGSPEADTGSPEADTAMGDADSGAPDPNEGGGAYRGEVLVYEHFDDDDFGSRGWYDGPSGTISTTEHVEDSQGSWECHYAVGGTVCRDGKPGRVQFDETESVYLSYWVKYSDNYVGSQRPYHPHEFHFITNKDDRWVGPARTHLTTYIEQVGGRAHLAIQDSRNVDTGCILRNNDAFVGCGGNFETYAFTENRSVAACNGLMGYVDGRDCFETGGGNWYSARYWNTDEVVFKHEEGPGYKGDWSFVEAYFELNDIVDGAGVANGKIRYWLDGNLLLSSDEILLRTAQHADMAFNQFLIAPYIGDGSPVAQTMWVDKLTIARGQK